MKLINGNSPCTPPHPLSTMFISRKSSWVGLPNRVCLHYRIYSEDLEHHPVLFLLHPPALSLEFFDLYFKDCWLRENFTLVAFDSRGHGKTTAVSGPCIMMDTPYSSFSSSRSLQRATCLPYACILWTAHAHSLKPVQDASDIAFAQAKLGLKPARESSRSYFSQKHS